mgnify:CR=1 FL=1
MGAAGPLTAELRRRGVTVLMHYSPAENLSSILRHGILSRRARQAAGVLPAAQHGWGTSAHGQAYAAFVCLGFAAHRVMMAKERGAVAVFRIAPAIVEQPGVCFAPHNTALADIDPEYVCACTGAEALGLLFADDGGARLRDPQCEILIPDRIPVAAIAGVTVHASGGAVDWPRTCWWRCRRQCGRILSTMKI